MLPPVTMERAGWAQRRVAFADAEVATALATHGQRSEGVTTEADRPWHPPTEWREEVARGGDV